jgi:U3 small nucleolar RNA-associated protein 22
MEADTKTDSRTLKVNDLLKDARLDYDSLRKLVDDTVSSIKEAIDGIPEKFQVVLCASIYVILLWKLFVYELF